MHDFHRHMTQKYSDRPVSPHQIVEGTVSDYCFDSNIRGELNGRRPVTIIGREPGIRFLKGLDIQVVPISSAPGYPEDENVALTSRFIVGRAIIDKITTINPLKLKNFRGRLTRPEIDAIKAALAKRLEFVPPNPKGRSAHLKPGDIIAVPFDRAPHENHKPRVRRYVVLDNRRTHLHVDNIQAVPYPDNRQFNGRIRSFAIDRVADLEPLGKIDNGSLATLRTIVAQRLDLPWPGQQPAP